MMGLFPTGWKRLALVLSTVVFIFLFFHLIAQSDLKTQYEQLQHRLLACTHQSEALSTQLEVLNHYKEKVENVLKNTKNEQNTAIDSCKKRILSLEKLAKECNKGEGIDSILTVKEENEQLTKKIKEMEGVIDKLKKQENVKNETQIDNNTKKGALSPNHPNESEVYAKGPDVHFHRKQPLDEPLEFKRDGGEEVKIDDWVDHKDLVKKIKDREEEKNAKNEENNFQILAKPDGQEEDYKEMH